MIRMLNIDLILKALANEKRRLIIEWLKSPGEHFVSTQCDVRTDGVCVGLIEQKCELSQSTVSHYLKQLHQAELITMERNGQWTFCKLNHQTLEETLILLGKDLK